MNISKSPNNKYLIPENVIIRVMDKSGRFFSNVYKEVELI